MSGLRGLTGRRALVTGSATGVGRATVKRLASDGTAVIVNYVGSADAADELVEELRRSGATAAAIQADVADEEQVVAMFARAAAEVGGPVDVLVNNAGVEKPFRLVDMPLKEWNNVLGVILTGAFLCAREAARGLRAAGSGGVIVNVSSVHEVIPWPQFSHYCASKAGMKLFGQTIARELAPDGIRVVQVAPRRDPHADQPGTHRRLRQAARGRRGDPWGRLGKPEEVAGAISWLASDEADYITGSTLFVDGGMTLYPKFV